ncbi:MAG: hypothetical protein IPO26_19420 [Saprospiraceae bacterium]|nr:hypothetical protein [Saprospiraceae bacterium]
MPFRSSSVISVMVYVTVVVPISKIAPLISELVDVPLLINGISVAQDTSKLQLSKANSGANPRIVAWQTPSSFETVIF